MNNQSEECVDTVWLQFYHILKSQTYGDNTFYLSQNARKQSKQTKHYGDSEKNSNC